MSQRGSDCGHKTNPCLKRTDDLSQLGRYSRKTSKDATVAERLQGSCKCVKMFEKLMRGRFPEATRFAENLSPKHFGFSAGRSIVQIVDAVYRVEARSIE